MCSKTQNDFFVRLDGLADLEPALAQRDHLAGVDLPHQLRADDVERTALGGDEEVGPEAAERQRPDPVGIAEGADPALRHHDGRVGALEPRHRLDDRVLDPLLVGRGQERRDDLRVGGAAEGDAPVAELGEQLDRVGQVAVVGERDLAAVVAPDRLGVLPGAAAGRRVADVTDRHRPGEALQLLLVEDLGDEPEVAQGHDHPALAGRDPRRLLAAMLQREEAEVAEPRDVATRRVNAEDAAFVARSVAVVEEPLGQEEVWPSGSTSSGIEAGRDPAAQG